MIQSKFTDVRFCVVCFYIRDSIDKWKICFIIVIINKCLLELGTSAYVVLNAGDSIELEGYGMHVCIYFYTCNNDGS